MEGMRNSQPALEEYGFTSRRRPQPWQPSDTVPEIPLHWLTTQPQLAWELFRNSYLFSRAPIPPLLHTCSDSRAELMAQGYQLAFGTRSSKPRTWFNFARDVLFLTRESASTLRDYGGQVGQFDPEDLKRIRKLALERSCYPLLEIDMESWYSSTSSAALSTIQLFPNLVELLTVEWTEDPTSGFPWYRWKTPKPNPTIGCMADQDKINAPPRPWQCLAVEEVDAMLQIFRPGRWEDSELYSAGHRAWSLQSYKSSAGRNLGFFEKLGRREQRLLFDIKKLVRRAGGGASLPLSDPPKVCAVHILPPDLAKFLISERQAVWGTFFDPKLDPLKIPVLEVHRQGPDCPDNVTSLFGPLGPLEGALLGTSRDICDCNCAVSVRERRGWIETGEIPPPVSEFLY